MLKEQNHNEFIAIVGLNNSKRDYIHNVCYQYKGWVVVHNTTMVHQIRVSTHEYVDGFNFLHMKRRARESFVTQTPVESLQDLKQAVDHHLRNRITL